MAQDFRKLVVWRKAHLLALAVYDATSAYPRAERFGLTAQSRRCAVSVPSNVAEACGRRTHGEYVHFLGIAFGSANELDYQLLLARDLGFMPAEKYTELRHAIDESAECSPP